MSDRILVREHEADLIVADRTVAADGVAVLTLVDPAGEDLPAWTPGAHIDLILGPSLTRQYSLCGSPNDRKSWRIGVLRTPDSRGGSQHVHENLQTGTTVRVRGPRNHFTLVDSPRYVFIAGGIGITPILAMTRAVDTAGASWELHYGGRTRTSMAFIDELDSYVDRVSVQPQDELGLLDLESILGEPREDTLVYCCGPEPLMAAVEKACTSWLPGSLHLERFSPKASPESIGRDQAFVVTFQRSGLTGTVSSNQSILEVAEQSGLSVLYSCREGTCGSCETAVIEGEPDHRDSVLTTEEQETGELMMICVSRCRSPRLVLDL
jgi:ferredoxin-NADP reductase